MENSPVEPGATAGAQLDQYEVTLPKAAHSVVISLDAVSSGKRRNDVRVRMEEPWARPEWELASDEPSAIGGEETAPMPLSIFATGVATCFMTQVRNFARQRGFM
ncbi:hypothetical protein E5720_17745 [Rhodococcus sp. PAMC28707]|uniref:hypothetical protein n=1 Tax=unclassified Rhodococcus (in: high G+C Gram-positive bacteria) TaxID=192944 RepID=UPI00109D8CBF|nr:MULTISPECIES: hypothetical protein [unclassified Rhodococcus (in: high G+C Gram-positive bacteria)]QCB51778.1 hypothetical protein E5769_17780 [Rhodococcus sp. PAMC28705]QCB60054.1 hypothetical protein E5720_17745 [Rhodococcus sp. PAMC28707]